MNRLFSVHAALGAGALVLCVVLAPVLTRHAFGPRSRAAVALVLFAVMFGVVVLWRRIARRHAGAVSEVDEG